MKKRMISLLLTLIVVLGMVPMGALAVESPLQISLVEQNNFATGKDAAFTFAVKNTTSEATSAYLLTGLYENGKMITYNYIEKEIAAQESFHWGTLLAIPSSGNYQLKAFAWDSMTDPDTISNVLAVEMEESQPLTYKEVMEGANATVAAMVNEKVDIGLEQAIMSLARKDRSQLSEDDIQAYYGNVKEHAQEQLGADEHWSNKVTDVERVILALAAIGKDPADVGGINLYNYIWNKETYMMDHDGNPSTLGDQGLNELTFGLLALDALPDVKQPDDATISRDEMIDRIYEYKTTDGGFGLNKGGQSIDINMTAMTLQALAPYYLEDETVKCAIDTAVSALSEAQAENGDFKDDFAKEGSVESLAQVLVALSTLEIDADTDSRFIKNGNSVLDALLAYYDSESGGFKHTLDESKLDTNATQQALYALVAYDRFKNEKNALYDMSKELIGTVSLSIEKRAIGKGDTLSKTEYKLYENETAWDVFQRVCKRKNISYKNADPESPYIYSIAGVGASDYGKDSFWSFEVNNTPASVGVGQYSVHDGDHICFRYCLTWEACPAPLADYLKGYLLKEAQDKLGNSDIKDESKEVLRNAVAKIEDVVTKHPTDSTEDELAVSAVIGDILSAYEELVDVTAEDTAENG